MLRRLSISLGIVMSLAAAPFASGESEPVRADRAPAFQGLHLDGTAFDSAELESGFVLLDFWGVWCPPCIGAFPKLSRLHDDYAHRDFQVVGLAVLSGTPEEVAEFVEDYDVTYPIVVVEREVPDLFDVLSYPTYVLVGPGREIVETYRGQPGDLYEIVSGDLEGVLPVARLDTPTPPS